MGFIVLRDDGNMGLNEQVLMRTVQKDSLEQVDVGVLMFAKERMSSQNTGLTKSVGRSESPPPAT